MYGMALCAGVGGLELGLKLALGDAYQCKVYVEREAFAAATLARRMQQGFLDQGLIWDDLESFDGRPWRGIIQIISAGFPCQPWSGAGPRRGVDDDRWLWPAIARIVLDVGSRYVFLENVPGLVSGGGIEHVLSSLSQMGFDAEWCHLTASAVGASHRRRRVFILAYSRRQCQQRRGERGDIPGETDVGDARRKRVQARLPAEFEESGSQVGQAQTPELRCGELGHAESSGRGESFRLPAEGFGPFPPGPGDRTEWERIFAAAPWLAPAVEPGLRVLVDGTSLVLDESWVDQLRACGNGVVPLQAALAFALLARRIEDKDIAYES